jgi:hypothetical protein
MKSRKGYSLIVTVLIVAALLSIAAFIILAFWTPSYGKGIKQLGGYLDDCDKDTVKDNSDACPCDTTEKGVQFNRGCPEGYIIRGDNSGREDKTCIEKGCPKTT